MALPVKILAGAALATLLSFSPALAAPTNEPVDLIRDKPSVAANAFEALGASIGWLWDKTTDALSVILPPSPVSLAKTVDDKDQVELVTLLSYAGYKLKEIDSQVGVIPTIAFKFGLTRELSEADWDYLDYRLELSRFRTPGLGATLQRAIVGTVMTINTGGAYQVSELKVQILPLPKVAFSVAPKITALGDESSTLLRAIQRMERRLRGDIAGIGGRVLPGKSLQKLVKAHDWLVGGAIVLFGLAVLVELRRNLRPVHRGRPGPALALTLLGLGVTAWVAAALVPLSLLTLAGGIAAFGLIALMAAAKGPMAAEPAAVPAPEMPAPPLAEVATGPAGEVVAA